MPSRTERYKKRFILHPIALFLCAGLTVPGQARTQSESQAADVTYSVQVGANLNRANAERTFKALAGSGYEAYMEPAKGVRPEAYYVRVGEFKDLGEAVEALNQLVQKGFSPLITCRRGGPDVTMGAQGSEASNAAAAERDMSSDKSGAQDQPSSQAAGPGPTAQGNEAEGAQMAASGSEKEAGASSIVKALAATLFVVGLIMAFFFMIRRWMPGSAYRGREKLVRMLDTLALGDRRSIALVEVGDDRYLVGATPQSISLLAKVESQLQERFSAERGLNGQVDGPGTRDAQVKALMSKLKVISKTLSL